MYSSLHKVDIVADIDGTVCVQTDHRDRAEIEAQREISIVFGVTRMLAPGLADPTKRKVQYVCMGEVPPFLRELIRVCGATFTENGEKTPREPAVAADLDAVARMSHDALMTLGREVLARRGLEATPEGVLRLEEAIRDEDQPDLEENEIQYYENMVELAAAAGVVIAAREQDARWRVTPQVMSLVPLAIDVRGSLTNLFGRTERFFEGEVSQGPAALVEITEQRSDAPVVGILKPAEWGRGHPVPALSEPLTKSADMPLIAYAHDHPNAVAYINTQTGGMTLDEARAKAEAFYRTIEVSVERLSPDLPLFLVTGGYYAPEKLLDRAFARELHVRLECETLLVAMPARGVAAVVPVRTDPREASVVIASFAERAQERCPPAERISKIPFIMMDGQIVGYVSTERDGDDAPEPPRKGFWRRLFGG